jgi:hypothetical protein
MTFYKQCTMSLASGEGRTSYQTAWIPEQFAKRGKYLRIKNENGDFDNGWLVERAGRKRLEESLINSDEHRHHRSVTDV